MDEYISREAVLSHSEIIQVYSRDYGNIDVVPVEYLADIPAADVQPVKHGRWMYPFYCSECGFTPYYSSDLTYNYCPNCGANMKGDVENARIDK